MSNSLNNYFERVDGTQLNFGSGFATNLKGILDNIDENFQRIVGAPFIQGDHGKNLVRNSEEIYETDDKFSTFGKAFIKAIWGDAINPTGFYSYSDLEQELDDSIGGSNYSCSSLDPTNPDFVNTVDYYTLEPDTASAYKSFVSLVFFYDERLSELRSSFDPNYHNFEDHSCVLYGTYEKDDQSFWFWNIKRYDVLPLIYFDLSRYCFCWKLNGIETGISCEGTIGPNGEPSNIWLCNGVRYTDSSITPPENNFKIVINNVIASNTGLSNPQVSDIEENDLVYVWFDNCSDNIGSDTIWTYTYTHPSSTPYDDFMMGVILLDEPGTNYKYALYNENYTLGFLSQAGYVLRNELKSLGYYSATPTDSNLRGVFLPTNGLPYTNGQDASFIYTVNSSSNENELHIADVPYANTFGTTLSDDEISEYNTDSKLIFDYDSVETLPIVETGDTAPSRWLKKEYKDDISGDPIGVSELSSVVDSSKRGVNFKVTESTKSFEAEIEVNRPNDAIYIGDINPFDSAHPIIPGNGSPAPSVIEPFGTVGIQMLENGDAKDSLDSLDLTGNSLGSYKYANIFNFSPDTAHKTNVSNFNMRYLKHVLLSEDKWMLSLCFNPVMYTTQENGSYLLNMKLPSLKLIKDWSGNHNSFDYVTDYCFGNGSHQLKTGLINDHEIVVARETKFIKPSDVAVPSFETNLSFVAVNDAHSDIGSSYQNLALKMGSHTKEESIGFSSAFAVEDDALQFEINTILDKLLTDASVKSIVLFSEYPLIKLENDIELSSEDDPGTQYHVAPYLGFAGMAAKLVNSDESTATVEFVFLWRGINDNDIPSVISTQEVNSDPTAAQTNYLEAAGEMAIIKRNSSYTISNSLFYDSNASTTINANVNNLLAVSCVVTFDKTSYKVLNVVPLNKDASNGATVDTNWAFRRSGVSYSGLSLYNWEYLAFLGENYTAITSLANKLYILAPKPWNISNSAKIDKNYTDASTYDFYTIDIGNSSISTLKKYEDFDFQKISGSFLYTTGGSTCSPTYYRYMGSMVQGINSSGYFNKKITDLDNPLTVVKQQPNAVAAVLGLPTIYGLNQNLDYSNLNLRSVQNTQNIRLTQQVALNAQDIAKRSVGNDFQLLDINPIP